MKSITRNQFLERTTLASAGVLLSSLESWALTKEDKKLRNGLIGCGSVSIKNFILSRSMVTRTILG